MNRDPIEEEGGEHLYAFVLNNSLNAIDAHDLNSSNPGGTAGSLTRDYWDIMEWLFAQEGKECVKKIGAGLAIGGIGSDSKGKGPEDPCDLKERMFAIIREHYTKVRVDYTNFYRGGGKSGDIPTIPGMTPELQKFFADFFQAAADCSRKNNKDPRFNDLRAKHLIGEIETIPPGTGRSNLPPFHKKPIKPH